MDVEPQHKGSNQGLTRFSWGLKESSLPVLPNSSTANLDYGSDPLTPSSNHMLFEGLDSTMFFFLSKALTCLRNLISYFIETITSKVIMSN